MTSMPLAKDGLIHAYNNCTKEKVLSKNVLGSRESEQALAPFKKLTEAYNIDLKAEDMLALYYGVDSLRCRHCHQLPLSCTNCDVHDIFNAMDKFIDVIYFSSPKLTTEHKRLRIGTFLLTLKQNLLNEFNRRTKNNETSKAYQPGFFYFSAHDVTLSSLLSILDFNQTHSPPYASNFILE
ncbi:2-phosphoxylose phosphatase 1, partial [Massospora cicadina]